MPRALVTGASGFVGSTLVEELVNSGVEVRALLRSTSSVDFIKGVKFERFDGSLTDAASLARAVKDVDYVFHVAGLVSARNKAEFFDVNAEGTRRIADAVAKENPKIKRFVQVSSLAAGGPMQSKTARTENDLDAPVSEYGRSKLEGERALLKYRDQFPIVILRPPIVYGPRDKGVFVFIQSVARNVVPFLRGRDGQKYFSAIYVKDLCKAIVQAGLHDPVSSGEVFYVSGDEVFSFDEMISGISSHMGKKPLKIPMPKLGVKLAAWMMEGVTAVTGKPQPLNADKLNEIFEDYWICSNQKAKKMLGFSPQYDLSAGMAETIKWYQDNRWI